MLSPFEEDALSSRLYEKFAHRNPFPKIPAAGETISAFRVRQRRWYDEQDRYIRRARERLLHDEEEARRLIEPPENRTPVTMGGKNSKPLVFVTSPMMAAQFYPKPSPKEPSFVSIGQHVMPETIVCLVEACKVFSELKAKIAGTVRLVCVKEGVTVYNGDRLIGIEPD